MSTIKRRIAHCLPYRSRSSFVCSFALLGITCVALMAITSYRLYDPAMYLFGVEDFIRGLLRPWPSVGYQSSGSRLNTALREEEGWPSCSLRWKAKRHATHAKHFNFSISLLTMAKDQHPSVFGRLRSYNLPYGWKNVPEETITETLQLLNNSWSGQLFERGSLSCVRCAVVGNGGILNGSGQGTAIDSHHYVFRYLLIRHPIHSLKRVNGAVTEGFEKDVGTRTSFYGFSTNSMKNSLLAYGKVGFTKVPQGQDVHYVFIPASSRDYLMLAAAIRDIPVTSGYDIGDHPRRYFGANRGANHFKILSPEFINYIKDVFLNSSHVIKYPTVYIPSTGALMLMTALHTCDQVSAFGFMTENYKDFSDHYFDAVKLPLVLYANHDSLMEMELWAELHAQKVMWLYQRPSNV